LGKNIQQRTAMFHAYRNLQRSVRKDEWKMIVYKVKGQETIQLFNLKNDPLEMNNLANNQQFKKILASMQLEMTKQKVLNNDL
jgi:arylsulfatase A-like enzyme